MSISEAFCPECGQRLKLGTRPFKGQRVLCSACETNLSIVSLSPLELEVAMSTHRIGRKKSNSVEVACPECEASIRLSARAREGQQILCDECDTLLEIISADPLELDVATMVDIKPNRWQKGKRSKYSER